MLLSSDVILIISHKKKRCGVYQYGLNIAEALKKSTHFVFVYRECANKTELHEAVLNIKPAVIIYNYYQKTMPWLGAQITRSYNIPQLGIMHEVTQEAADEATNEMFDYHLCPDPTLQEKNSIIIKTKRLIPPYTNVTPLPDVTTIGSFGFGFGDKGFERLVYIVQNEFDRAKIVLHMPFNDVMDKYGLLYARTTARRCRRLITKSEINLHINHKYMDKQQLLDFLASNTLNAFFYDTNKTLGISSTIEHALAVNRPLAITKCGMFRHVYNARPSICIEDSTLASIINNGIKPLMPFYDEWSEENFIADYERILKKVLTKKSMHSAVSPPCAGTNQRNSLTVMQRLNLIAAYLIKHLRLFLYRIKRLQENLRDRKKPLFFNLPNVMLFNRILDDEARSMYAPIIKQLFQIVPRMMSRKIPEANIQQAFVLDTVYRFAKKFGAPRILCVGSYEDTACAALKKLGYQIKQIDPQINYDLNAFSYLASTIKESYDIIFSTSVIEHVKDDELFITQIVELLAPRGIAVLTCDYNDQYTPGNKIPDEDFRLYTQKDFKRRFVPLLKKCSLIDDPLWDCERPDFSYAGCQYTFATFVFQKNE